MVDDDDDDFDEFLKMRTGSDSAASGAEMGAAAASTSGNQGQSTDDNFDDIFGGISLSAESAAQDQTNNGLQTQGQPQTLDDLFA